MDHSAATASVKITLSGSKRRVRLNVPLRFSQLRQYVRSTFPDIKDFNLHYVDDEGDTIIVGNNEELVEAQNVFKDLGRIPSFTVNKLASPPPTAPSDVRPPLGRMHCEKRCRFGPCGRGNISGRQSLAKVMEFPISKAMASHFAKTGFPVLHLGITCDVSGQHPLIGTRYHKIGKNYDLNEAEFAKLTREEQEAFEVIGFMGARPIPVKSLKPNQAIHFGVICDKSNQNPLLGVRYHKIGQNYDLNEDEFSKLTSAEQKKYEMISRPGATPVPVLNAGPDCSKKLKESKESKESSTPPGAPSNWEDLKSYLETRGFAVIRFEKAVKLLGEKADAHRLTPSLWFEMLFVAVLQDQEYVVGKIALEEICDGVKRFYGKMPFSCVLIEACKRGHLGIVKKLLAIPGIDFNQGNYQGYTPLLLACHKGDVDIVKTLLEMPGINVNKCAMACGRTPLFVACCNSHLRHEDTEKIVAFLLKHPDIDIDVEFTSPSGEPYTPLWMAEQTCGPSSATVQLLRRAKQNKWGVGTTSTFPLQEGNQNSTGV